MPQDGYEYWTIDDPLPYPVGDINVSGTGESLASADCTLKFPTAIPYGKTIAEKSVGISNSWRFTFGLRSERVAGGKIDNQIVCTAKHITWFPDHGETGPGGVQTFEVDESTVMNKPKAEIVKDREHGPHFDRVNFIYTLLANGSVDVTFLGCHQTWGRIGEADKPAVTPGAGTLPESGERPHETPAEPPAEPKREPKPHPST
jgi:hypothetical protein